MTDAFRPSPNLDLDEHARAQLASGIGEGRLYLNVAGRFIDDRLKRVDSSREYFAGKTSLVK